jgi:hypothetical protein
VSAAEAIGIDTSDEALLARVEAGDDDEAFVELLARVGDPRGGIEQLRGLRAAQRRELLAASAGVRTEDGSKTLEQKIRALPGDPVIQLLTEIRYVLLAMYDLLNDPIQARERNEAKLP